jgi:threonine dehydrogenase-like Zn-dependent dehydrogenase
MRAVVWHGREDVRVDRVADPTLEEPTDAIVRLTSTAICGSDASDAVLGLTGGGEDGAVKVVLDPVAA